MKLLITSFLLILSLTAIAESNRWQGQSFASFQLKDQSGEVKTNKDFSDGWVVYYFYPKDRTPGCTVEAQKFSDDYQKFKQLNTEIVGISYDDVESHIDFADTYEIKFSLLADTEKKLTKAMDVDSFLPWPHPSRETFLVNADGIIVKHYSDVEPATHSQQLIADIMLLQK